MKGAAVPSRLLCTALASTFAVSASAPTSVISVPGGHVSIWLEPSEDGPSAEIVIPWVRAAAVAVAGYYGAFPVRESRLVVRVGEGHGVQRGTTYESLSTHIVLGRRANALELGHDWVMTHEFIHLAFPSVGREHDWIAEGIATYVEPIARARAGQLSPDTVWADLVRDLPQGLPQPGDEGLDHTHTWARTYWGGALFCLLADVEIRKRTHNERGLEHALRAVVRSGGTLDADWDVARAFQSGDEATGVPVLRELYEQMRGAPVQVDLSGLWRNLGVAIEGGRARFDDDAPLAGVRLAITAGSTAEP